MIVILGAKGMLGAELTKVFGNEAVGWDRGDCDVTNAEDLKLKIVALKPAVIINCIAYNDVDGAEANQGLAFKLNAEAVKNLSEVANGLDVPLVHFSTNYVFDGQKGEYLEDEVPNPQSVYGKSKYQGEQNLLTLCKKPYLVRTASLFGSKGQSEHSKKSFVEVMLELSEKNDTITVVNDEINNVTYAKDLAQNVRELLENNYTYGVYHITNAGAASWYDFAKEIFKISKRNIKVVPILSKDFPRDAHRPKAALLINSKLPQLRPWQEALSDFLTPHT